jgi:REP element-mobilizing transposase RayT
MPRPPRLEFPSALYHVTARGNERRALFRDDRDRNAYLSRIAYYREKFRFRLLAYCLMTNHVHLAIRTGLAPLSRIMAGLHSSYAERFNRRHERVGHLFQGRYKAFLVQEDRYLHALLRYIHRNPVQARLVRRAGDYAWSSDRFLRRGRGPEWLDVHHVLSLLEESGRRAVTRYAEIVDGPEALPSYESLPAFERAVVGDEAFATERLEAVGERKPALGLSVERLLEIVARETGIPVAVLYGPRRYRAAAAARCLAAHLARDVCGIPIRRLARRLGRDDSAFSRPLARLEATLTADPAFARRVERLVRTVRAAASDKSTSQD